MTNECEHEPQDVNMEYFIVLIPNKDDPEADVIEVSLCSKCHLLYWGWSEVKKNGEQ